MSEVMIIRLISGEEIIANVTKNGNNTITLKDPTVLIPSPEGKLLLARWIPYADTDDGVTLEERHLVFTVKPQKQLEEHYTTTVVNNLVIPGKKIVDPTASGGLKLTV